MVGTRLRVLLFEHVGQGWGSVETIAVIGSVGKRGAHMQRTIEYFQERGRANTEMSLKSALHGSARAASSMSLCRYVHEAGDK